MTKMNKSVKVFTHTDMDGVGVGIVAQAFFGKDMTNITYCENHEVDSKIKDFLDSGDYIHYGMVIVGDISFGKEVADIIDANQNLRDKFLVVDHHKTALWLNNYPFAMVEVERNGLKASGTSSLFEILCEMGYEVKSEYNDMALRCFAEKVRRYDSWDWYNIYKDSEADMLNQLYYMVGREEFISSMMDKLNSYKIHVFVEGVWKGLFSKSEQTMLIVENNRMEAYIESRCKNARFCQFGDFTFAYVYADQYHSQLGNAICHKLDVDFAMVVDINKGKVSLRSIGDFDVSEIAKQCGGGGHKNASGYMFDVDHNAIMQPATAGFKPKKQGLLAKVKKLIDNMF